jgi:peptidoglycan/LPS O-acetylase OafA/YrhL
VNPRSLLDNYKNVGRSNKIDAMRGIAAISVVIMHSSEVAQRFVYGDGYPLLKFFTTIDIGRIGVVVFFLISGFLIPSSLGEKSKGGGIRFWIRRFFRLYPTYWVSILASLCGVWIFLGESVPIRDAFANILMFQEYLGFQSIAGLYWTLHVELVFYVCVFILYQYGLNLKRSALSFCVVFLFFVSVVILVWLGSLLKVIEKGDDFHRLGMTCFHLAIMFFGALFRNVIESGEIPSIRSFQGLTLFSVPVIFAAVFLITIGIIVLRSSDPSQHDILRLGLSYPIAMAIFIMIILSRTQFEHPLLPYLGKVSYSLYLFHPSIIYPVAVISGSLGIGNHLSPAIGGPMIILTATFTSIAAAVIMYHSVEAPSTSLARKFHMNN